MTATVINRSAFAALYLQRGIERLRRNEFASAVADFDAVLAINPSDPYAHWNKATALLSMGDYRHGFIEHDWGWHLFRWSKFDISRVQALPVWHGVFGGSLLVYHELGHGDALMAFRFLPELRRHCGPITLVIDPALVSLASRYDIEVVTAVPDDLAPFEWRLPLFGVMRALDVTTETVPRAPYIEANWQRTGGKLGLCWSGNTQQSFASNPAWFKGMLVGCRGYRFYSLQPGPVFDTGIVPLDAADFAATAKLIERLDHIVTVDTAVAHLAGAMGHPSTHVILPYMGDWRWWHTAVWYPHLKTHRQPRPGDDWSVPFARIREAIHAADRSGAS